MVSKVIDGKPTSCNILVELLTDAEVLGTTKIIVKDSKQKKTDAPQAYVLDIGPGFDKDDVLKTHGVKVGDRIILSGGFVPLPKYHSGERERGLIDISSIRAVLIEESNSSEA